MWDRMSNIFTVRMIYLLNPGLRRCWAPIQSRVFLLMRFMSHLEDAGVHPFTLDHRPPVFSQPFLDIVIG